MLKYENMEDKKRRLIGSLEAARSTRQATDERERENVNGGMGCTPDESMELARLREDLLQSRKTCAMLEDELRQLESKALSAIVEAGAMRRRIDTNNLQFGDHENESWALHVFERAELVRQIEVINGEKQLLLRALSDSEREIGRLTKTLDLLAGKFQAA